MTRFIGLLIVPVAVILAILWSTAGTAHAAVYEETCHRQPLTQAARPGETVEVCELHRVPSRIASTLRRSARLAARNVRRPGVTTVVHYGTRAPVYTIAYIK